MTNCKVEDEGNINEERFVYCSHMQAVHYQLL